MILIFFTLGNMSIVIANRRTTRNVVGAELLFLPSKGIKHNGASHVIAPSYAHDEHFGIIMDLTDTL